MSFVWMSTRALVASVMLALCACATTSMGRPFNTAHVPDIRLCATTEKQLLAWFGEPLSSGYENGFSTLQWYYATMHMRAWESEMKSQSLVVVLNRDGKVVRFTLSPTTDCKEVKRMTDICAGEDDAMPPPIHAL